MNKILKYSLMAATALLALACNKENTTGGEDDFDVTSAKVVVLEASGNVFVANGKDQLVLSVLADGHDITKRATFYRTDNGYEQLASNVFTTTKPGIYKFWATVPGVKDEKIREIEVEAVSISIPDAPKDPDPANTDFVRKVLVTQYTGTWCQFCPEVIVALDRLEADNDYKDKFLLAAYHSKELSDPMNLQKTYLSTSGYPYVSTDYAYETINGSISVPVGIVKLKDAIDKRLAEDSGQAGIAVNSQLTNNTVVVKAQIKAAAANTFYLGAYLLEDGIMATQVNSYSDPVNNTLSDKEPIEHNSAIRVDANFVENAGDSYGVNLGKLEAGKTAEYTFRINLDPSWEKDNCRLLLYVSTLGKNGGKVVSNVITAPINGSTVYEYKK